MSDTPKIHILMHGLALCGAGFPLDWPNGELWWGFNASDVLQRATCTECVECYKRSEQRTIPGDRVSGHLMIGANERGEVVINFAKPELDSEGRGYIAFSPNQAMQLAALLRQEAIEVLDSAKGTNEVHELAVPSENPIK